MPVHRVRAQVSRIRHLRPRPPLYRPFLFPEFPGGGERWLFAIKPASPPGGTKRLPPCGRCSPGRRVCSASCLRYGGLRTVRRGTPANTLCTTERALGRRFETLPTIKERISTSMPSLEVTSSVGTAPSAPPAKTSSSTTSVGIREDLVHTPEQLVEKAQAVMHKADLPVGVRDVFPGTREQRCWFHVQAACSTPHPSRSSPAPRPPGRSITPRSATLPDRGRRRRSWRIPWLGPDRRCSPA